MSICARGQDNQTLSIQMRFLAYVIFCACLGALGYICKHYWGRVGQLWFVGTLTFLWFAFWVAGKVLYKYLRDRGIEVPDEDG